jgi:uncharacterized protein YegJ (DUF2314 family)
MRQWFAKRDRPFSPVTIPLKSQLDAVYVVYFAPAEGLPEQASLQQTAAAWQDANLKSPLRDDLAKFRDTGFLTFQVEKVGELPRPPVNLLRYTGLGEVEERILNDATHAVVVRCADMNAPPRFGLWSALAASLAVAGRLKGLVFDPEALRIFKLDAARRWFTERGNIAASQHIIVPFSLGHKAGLGWMTTRGMSKFGFPDLELRDVSPNLDRLSILMNSVAQLLIEAGMRKTVETGGKADQLDVPGEVAIEPELVAKAQGRETTADSPQPAAAIRVGLQFDPKGRSPDPLMIRLVPPEGERDTGVWLNKVAGVLLGSTSNPRMVKTASERMQEAHTRAIAEMPYAKKRFADGLRPGELLFVKHGFETQSGSQEYLWLVVTQWPGQHVVGQLANDPHDVPGLKIGQTVTVAEADLFDWMIQLPGDQSEGGYTSQVVIEESRR